MGVLHLVTIGLLSSSAAREITFQPVSGFANQQLLSHGGEVDVTRSAFAGLTTYANLPYVHCLAREGEKVDKFDIAILGAPFDTVGGTLSVRFRFFEVTNHYVHGSQDAVARVCEITKQDGARRITVVCNTNYVRLGASEHRLCKLRVPVPFRGIIWMLSNSRQDGRTNQVFYRGDFDYYTHTLRKDRTLI
jgi:hypothetical protein